MRGEAQQGDRIREKDLRKKINRAEETRVWFSVFFDAFPWIPTMPFVASRRAACSSWASWAHMAAILIDPPLEQPEMVEGW